MHFLEKAIKALNTLLADLKAIGDGLRENKDAIRDSNAARQSQNIPQPFSIRIPEGVETRQSASEAEKKTKHQNKILFWQKVTFWAVAAYACIAALQLYATREASYEDQRPWVAGDHWEFPYVFTLSSDPCSDRRCVGIYIRNYGRTPAMNVKGGAKVTISSDDSSPIPGPTDLRPLRGVLPNDQTALWFTERMKPEDLAEYAKVGRLYVRARIEYCDIWDNFNWTNFCIYHESNKPDKEFWPCERLKGEVGTTRNGCQNFVKK
jgi:hypothetical protein